MRRELAIIGLLLLLGRQSLAADLPLKAPDYYRYPEINWTGTYVGFSGGGAVGESHGPLATFNFGINFQTYSQLVFGAEGDLSLGRLTGSNICAGCNFEDRWLATARLRAGYMIGHTLIFATGGFAGGDVQVSGPFGGASSATKIGYAVGGGVEFDLGQHWSLRGDYLHVDLGRFDCGASCGATPPQFRATSDKVSVGLIFRFFQNEVQEFTLAGPGTKPPPPR